MTGEGVAAEAPSLPENPEVTTAPAVAAIVTPGADGGVVQVVEEPGDEAPVAGETGEKPMIEAPRVPPVRTASIAMVIPAQQLFGG